MEDHWRRPKEDFTTKLTEDTKFRAPRRLCEPLPTMGLGAPLRGAIEPRDHNSEDTKPTLNLVSSVSLVVK